jgi:spore coat protein U-like protein
MRKLKTLKIIALSTVLAFPMLAGQAQAQNSVTVPVTATVQNAITVSLVNPLNFGTILAINDAAQTATATVATTDALTFGTSGAPAITAAVTGTPTAGEVTLAGSVGATINVTINAVVSPTDGTDTLTLSTFFTDVNGGGSTARTPGTPFAHTALALDTVLIGATLTTPAQPALIGDGAYAGSFDIVASY